MESTIENDRQDDIIKMKIMTMNCGNGPSHLRDTILHELQNNGPYHENYLDVLVINAQEIDFKKEFDSLDLSSLGYNTVMLNKKITRTKCDDINVLRGNTGICTYVIYKDKKFAPPKIDKSKFLTVANPNKGMLVQTFTLSPKNGKNTKLTFQTTSAHLDSYSQEKRLMEMRQGYKYSFPKVSNFAELAAITPDCRFYGGDQNTRFDLGSSENPYLNATTLETKALSILGFGVITTTNTPTYDKVLNEKLQQEFNKLSPEELKMLRIEHQRKESFDDYLRTILLSRILETEANAEVSDKKRMGKQPTGYLDISMHITGKDEDVSVQTVKAFDVTGEGLRDHAAVMSQLIEFQPHANELEKVKGHLLTKMKLFDQSQGVDATKGVYQRLKNALASADNDEKTQQDILVYYYNRYVVELPLQYFDAMLIPDFKKRIQAQELITRSRILDRLIQEKTDLLEAYVLKNEGTENEPKYPYPFDCSKDIQTRLFGTNPNKYIDIQKFLEGGSLPHDIKCYFEERLKTLELFKESSTLNSASLQTKTKETKEKLTKLLAPPPRKTKLESRDIWFYEGLVAFATKLIAKALSVLRQAYVFINYEILAKTLPNLRLQIGICSWFIAFVNKYCQTPSAHVPESPPPTNRI